jgi:hypothetical protein
MKKPFFLTLPPPLAILMQLTALAGTVRGANAYYLDSVNGLDTNNGQSQTTPIKTLAALYALSPPSGSTISIAKGSVYDDGTHGVATPETVNNGNGYGMLALGDNFVVSAYGTGPNPIIDGAAYLPSSGWTAYTTGGASHIWYRAIVLGHGNIGFQSNVAISGDGSEQPICWDMSATGAETYRMRPYGVTPSGPSVIGGTGTYRTEAAALSAMDSAPGSFLYDGTNLYVNTYAGTAPTALEIAAASKDSPVNLGNNCTIDGITMQHGLDSPLVAGVNGTVSNCYVTGGPRHIALLGGGNLQNTKLRDVGVPGDYNGCSAIAWYFNGSAQNVPINMDGVDFFSGVCADGISLAPNYTGSFCVVHNSGTGSFGNELLTNSNIQNCPGGLGQEAGNVTITNNVFVDVDNLDDYIGSGDVVVSSGNNFSLSGRPNASVTSISEWSIAYGAAELDIDGDTYTGSSTAGGVVGIGSPGSTVKINGVKFNDGPGAQGITGAFVYVHDSSGSVTVTNQDSTVTSLTMQGFIAGNSHYFTYTGHDNVYPEGKLVLFDSANGILADLAAMQAPPFNTEQNSIATGTTSDGFNFADNGATISITGYADQGGAITVPATIEGEPVVAIGSNAFYGDGSLTGVTLPSSLTSIGNDAFGNCTGLTSLSIPNGVSTIGAGAFSGCTGLASIAIPAGVGSIGDNAFDFCSGLTVVTIPNGVTSIGNNAFGHCTGLTTITFPSSLTSVGSNAFSNCAGLSTAYFLGNAPASFGGDVFLSTAPGFTIYYSADSTGFTTPTWQGYPAFVYVPGLGSFFYAETGTTVTITGFTGAPGAIAIPGTIDGKPVTEIGSEAFSGSSLTSFTLPNTVAVIADHAFANCNGLTNLVVPDSVASIGNGAFSGCLSLTKISIPAGVIAIDDEVFSGCVKLTQISVDPANPAYASQGGVLFDKPLTTLIQYPIGSPQTSYAIPTGVAVIESDAFYEDVNLDSVTIPASVIAIGDAAFSGCSGLASANFQGDAPASFGNNIFDGTASSFAVQYSADSTGFSTPAWHGYPAFPNTSSSPSPLVPNAPSSSAAGNSAGNGVSARMNDGSGGGGSLSFEFYGALIFLAAVRRLFHRCGPDANKPGKRLAESSRCTARPKSWIASASIVSP